MADSSGPAVASGETPQFDLFGDALPTPAPAPAGPAQSIYVHFEDVAGLEAFAKLIGQPVTTQTRRIQYPPVDTGIRPADVSPAVPSSLPSSSLPPSLADEEVGLALDPAVAGRVAAILEEKAMLAPRLARAVAEEVLAVALEGMRPASAGFR